MFKTTGFVNKDFLNEIKRYFFPLWAKLALALLPLCLLSTLVTDPTHYPVGLLVIGILYAVVIAVYFLQRKRIFNLHLKRMYETTGTYEMEYTVSFEEDGVVVQNHSTGANGKMKYDVMRKLVKGRSFYALITSSRQYVPIFIEYLSDQEKKALLAFLKSHAPTVKC